MINAYFDEHSEVIKTFQELQQNIEIIPSRYYMPVAKIIHDKIDTELAKAFLKENMPKSLDLEMALERLPKIYIFELSKLCCLVNQNQILNLRKIIFFFLTLFLPFKFF